MKLIVGLGNPGGKYEKTRHNVGFMVLDILAEETEWKESKKANCLYVKKQINSEKIELIKPLTFMNNSGRAINHIKQKHYFKPKDIVVVHDDIDLPLGEIRVQQNKNSAGHKGVQSIIDALGTKDFIRIRIGIRPDKLNIETEKFVIQKFNKEEKEIIAKTIKKAAQVIKAAF